MPVSFWDRVGFGSRSCTGLPSCSGWVGVRSSSCTGLPSCSGSVVWVVSGSQLRTVSPVDRICSRVPERHMVRASTAATAATAARPQVFCISRTQMVPITAPRAERGGSSNTSAVSRAVYRSMHLSQ